MHSMLKTLSLLSVYVVSGSVLAVGTDYIGKNSTEAILSFSSEVRIDAARMPTQDVAHEKILEQMNHLFGPMEYGTYKAVPKGDFNVTRIKVSRAGFRGFKASYDVSMIVAVANKAGNSYTVTLPVNPDNIYQAAMRGEYNPCTDDHYQSQGDFWYFWSPERPGCKLRAGRDYIKVKGTLERSANTRRTYAEVHRLADEEGVVTIDMLYGLDDPEKNSWNPYESGDVNAENYRYVARAMIKMGYERSVMSAREIRNISRGAALDQMPTVEVFTKNFASRPGRNVKTIKVLMFFGASGISESSTAFHYFLKNSLENSSMMIYAGHSGLGGHLDLEGIEYAQGFKIKPNKKRYQIYYFNSCTSYTYYNTQYFGRKKSSADPTGTKNLDIVTNGLATYFSAIDESNLELLRTADAYASGGTPLSYQEMVQKMDSDNLLGINGDEDNPVSFEDLLRESN